MLGVTGNRDSCSAASHLVLSSAPFPSPTCEPLQAALQGPTAGSLPVPAAFAFAAVRQLGNSSRITLSTFVRRASTITAAHVSPPCRHLPIILKQMFVSRR